MNISEKNLEEKIGEQSNFHEKIKNFWENYKKNWIWVNIGGMISYTFFLWFLYFKDFSSLSTTIYLTLVYPLVIFFVYYSRNSKNRNLITKIVIIGGGTSVFGCLIWLPSAYILVTAPWALLREVLTPNLKTAVIILLMVAIYGIVAYLLYRFGKKRDWNFFLKFYI